MKRNLTGHELVRAFSLVETVVAIGIFSFVIVGILALFPTAMRQHADSARESLGVQASQQIMASVAAATNLANVNIVTGYGSNRTTNTVNLLDAAAPLVLGFRKGSSVPIRVTNGAAWTNGTGQDPNAGEVDTLVRVLATNSALTANLYQINIDVGYPAAAPASKRDVDSFSTMVNKP